MQRANDDHIKHIFNDLAVLRMAAKHRGDEDEVPRIDEDIRETFEPLGRLAVLATHDGRGGIHVLL